MSEYCAGFRNRHIREMPYTNIRPKTCFDVSGEEEEYERKCRREPSMKFSKREKVKNLSRNPK